MPMPTRWWLRPVNRHARVGEHTAVVWKLVNRTPRRQPVEVRRVEVAPVAPELREAEVVEDDHHDVGRTVGTAARPAPPRCPPRSLRYVGRPSRSLPAVEGPIMPSRPGRQAERSSTLIEGEDGSPRRDGTLRGPRQRRDSVSSAAGTRHARDPVDHRRREVS